LHRSFVLGYEIIVFSDCKGTIIWRHIKTNLFVFYGKGSSEVKVIYRKKRPAMSNPPLGRAKGWGETQ